MSTQENPESSGSTQGAGALESFMYFPSPLALLNQEGQLELANRRFAQCLARAEIDPKSLAGAARVTDADWHPVAAADGLPRMRIRTVKTPHRVLVIGEDLALVAPAGKLDALLNRVKELEQLVATDHLTGAWNRTHLDHVIDAEITRSVSYRQPLSLILLDVDHFKRINDTHGHPAGDQLLCELVNLVRSKIRTSDLLFRRDGGEFVILLASAGYRHALVVAENVRAAVSSHEFAGTGSVTVSMGVAEHDASEEADAWYGRLDEALIAARSAGRNRVVVDRKGNSDRWAAERGASALRLDWLEGYECGNVTIDTEHREIFNLANDLIDASLRDPVEMTSFKSALAALIDHVERHFADEEAILSQLCYAQFEEHRRSHAGLLARARRFQKQTESEEFHMGNLVEFLAQDLVARHLRIVDRGFFPLFSK